MERITKIILLITTTGEAPNNTMWIKLRSIVPTLIPEIQLLIRGIYDSRTLPWIFFHEPQNFCQVLSRQLHLPGLPVFQGAFYVSAAHESLLENLRYIVEDSRGSRKRDDIVAKRTYPCDAQLGDRDAFTIRYGRQCIHELEVMSDVLGAHVWVQHEKQQSPNG